MNYLPRLVSVILMVDIRLIDWTYFFSWLKIAMAIPDGSIAVHQWSLRLRTAGNQHTPSLHLLSWVLRFLHPTVESMMHPDGEGWTMVNVTWWSTLVQLFHRCHQVPPRLRSPRCVVPRECTPAACGALPCCDSRGTWWRRHDLLVSLVVGGAWLASKTTKMGL